MSNAEFEDITILALRSRTCGEKQVCLADGPARFTAIARSMPGGSHQSLAVALRHLNEMD